MGVLPPKSLLIVAALLSGCASTTSQPVAPVAGPPGAPAAATAAQLEPKCSLSLAESWPIETSLDHPAIDDARDLWPAMIAKARRSVHMASFYVSASGTGALEPTLEAMQAAAARGVRVRVLIDSKLAGQYADSLRRLEAMPAVAVSIWDAEKDLGGVHHAKYMVIDDETLFVGSQNLDDRSLEHIAELGIGGACPSLARGLAAVFDHDWSWANGKRTNGALAIPWPRDIAVTEGGTATLSASPPGYLPAHATRDLAAIVEMVRSSSRYVDLQMLSFRPRYRDGGPFEDISSELVRAANRGVEVRVLVSNWLKGDRDRTDLRRLAEAGVHVRVIEIPVWSGGSIPFARVAHAKLVVADGERAWIGTSNGEGDYFNKGRNVGVVLNGGPIPQTVHGWFEDGWRLGKELD